MVLEVGGSIPLAHPAILTIDFAQWGGCWGANRPVISAATRSSRRGRSRPDQMPGRSPCAFQICNYLILLILFLFAPARDKHWVQIPALKPGHWGAMIWRSTRFRSPLPVNRIRAARQALGWTQNELARKAGVSARTIHAIEKGRSCRQATKRSILNALAVPWEMRDEYFQRARSVRRVRAIETAHSA